MEDRFIRSFTKWRFCPKLIDAGAWFFGPMYPIHYQIMKLGVEIFSLEYVFGGNYLHDTNILSKKSNLAMLFMVEARMGNWRAYWV